MVKLLFHRHRGEGIHSTGKLVLAVATGETSRSGKVTSAMQVRPVVETTRREKEDPEDETALWRPPPREGKGQKKGVEVLLPSVIDLLEPS